MPLQTSLTDLLGLQTPIVQAPIGSATCPELVAAVSNAGALGMLSVTWRDPDDLRQMLRETRRLTGRPFGVNLVLEWPPEERLQICLDEGVRVISFFWGDPAPYVPLVHEAGGTVMQTVSSASETRAAVRMGADVLVAQGYEAGGHIRGQVATLPLIPLVVDVAGDVPVVTAGGVADGRGVAAALTLGAAGVWLGTRFLASKEAYVHDFYKEAVLRANETDTVHTELFDVGWPNAPHRVLRNSTVTNWERSGRPQTSRPDEGEQVARHADGTPVIRYEDTIPLPGMAGEVEGLALYAGQSAGLIGEVKPAAEIVQDLTEEALTALQRARALSD